MPPTWGLRSERQAAHPPTEHGALLLRPRPPLLATTPPGRPLLWPPAPAPARPPRSRSIASHPHLLRGPHIHTGLINVSSLKESGQGLTGHTAGHQQERGGRGEDLVQFLPELADTGLLERAGGWRQASRVSATPTPPALQVDLAPIFQEKDPARVGQVLHGATSPAHHSRPASSELDSLLTTSSPSWPSQGHTTALNLSHGQDQCCDWLAWAAHLTVGPVAEQREGNVAEPYAKYC